MSEDRPMMDVAFYVDVPKRPWKGCYDNRLATTTPGSKSDCDVRYRFVVQLPSDCDEDCIQSAKAVLEGGDVE